MSRAVVRKTHKLYIGGAFPRSESGRTFEALDARGRFLANMARASRKDVRDAVVAARRAFGGWSARTPYNRGQVLYRVAEVMEGRREQLSAQLRSSTGAHARTAAASVDAAVDRVVWYAGWADKYAQVLGNANPVSSPFFNLSSPEPTGVVAVLAPEEPLLGFVSVVAPVIATGNTAVVLASEGHPIPAVTMTEVMAASDVPGGVVNVLTGSAAELGPWLASHMDVNAIDLTGIRDDDLAAVLARSSADNLKRVVRPRADNGEWRKSPSLERLAAFVETKTVWHPIGT